PGLSASSQKLLCGKGSGLVGLKSGEYGSALKRQKTQRPKAASVTMVSAGGVSTEHVAGMSWWPGSWHLEGRDGGRHPAHLATGLRRRGQGNGQEKGEKI